jgi:hypothetical protein
MSSCGADKTASISEPVLTKQIDQNTSKPIGSASLFNQSDPAIYFTVKITNFPENTTINAVWKYLEDNTEVKSQITSSGTGYESFVLKRNSSLFPAGKYEVTASAIVDDRTLEAKGTFEITSNSAPAHLLNPITSKSVDNNDKLNPVNISSEFSQSDQIIYFVIQTKELPKGTKVSCIWVYTDTGDSLSHELVTDGSRNVAFTLKPNESQTLPAGKYTVTAAVTLDGQTESVSKEFEIVK